MAAQVYTLKITYAGCEGRIWRTAAVSTNYTLSNLGYMVLATFETLAYHLFEMEYKATRFFLYEEDLEDLFPDGKQHTFLSLYKLAQLNMQIGDTIEMTYDMGCCQTFYIELLAISDMPRGHGRAYPKILDGAGRGIIDDMDAYELLQLIHRIDAGGHSGIYYPYDSRVEWDYRNYDLRCDNILLKGEIDDIRDGYEE